MRIAITGASGFVGRHVFAALAERGIDVVATARKLPADFPHSNRLQWVLMDLSAPGHDPFAQLGSPDVLLHLAWDGLPNYQSSRHLDKELPAQAAFLSACIDGGLKRLVVTGTCFEYGLSSGELDEQSPVLPASAYGSAKDQLRRHLELLQQRRHFSLTWLRLFYLYGEGQSPASLYSQLQSAIRRGDLSFDMSAGNQLRDFLPVEAAAEAIADAALSPTVSGIVNICSGKPVAVIDLARRWLEQSGSKMALNPGKLAYSEVEPMAFWGSRRKFDALVARP